MILEKSKTYRRTNDSDEHFAKSIAELFGADESRLLALMGVRDDTQPTEWDVKFGREINATPEQALPVLLDAGLLVPSWWCVTDRLGPLSVVGHIPRISEGGI
tara:strand:+ start:110 stop:418 length:309 start_codon:yes stop_codon:yes gene_type:complete